MNLTDLAIGYSHDITNFFKLNRISSAEMSNSVGCDILFLCSVKKSASQMLRKRTLLAEYDSYGTSCGEENIKRILEDARIPGCSNFAALKRFVEDRQAEEHL